jgi:HEAT repeat protein
VIEFSQPISTESQDVIVIEMHIAELRHTDPNVRFQAAQALGAWKQAQSVDALITALEDSHHKVQYAAFSSLVKINDVRAVHPMLEMLTSDLSSRVWGLMKLNIGMRLRHGLIEMTPRGDAHIRTMAQNNLADLRLDEQQRAFYVRVLGRTGGADDVEALIDVLLKDTMAVQAAAAEALGWIGDSRAIAPLFLFLEDANDQLREVAVEALGRIGDERAVEPVIQALGDPAEWVRRAAAEALGQLGDRRAIEPLSKALHDEDTMVQDAAFDALKKLSTDSYKAVL